MFPEARRHAHYIALNAAWDLRSRYAGSRLGTLWILASPALQVLLYAVVFSRIMEVQLGAHGHPEVPFYLYLCAGILPWIGFADIVTRSAQALLANASLVMNFGLPEAVFFLKEACVGYVVMLAGGAIVLALAGFAGVGPHASWFALPVVLLLFAALAFAMGTLAGVMTVIWRGSEHWLGFVLQLLMWASPIVYVESILPDAIREGLSFVPTYGFVTSLHATVLYGNFPPPSAWASMLAIVIVSATASLYTLSVSKSPLRDRL